ncbi:hypothetical protein [Streptomyces ureilyticus]|uniref:Large membrane protein n=1 Tax=Streptomyces ureilyticus TaxID=1775131 RepID=A0ABX0DQM4_9ACTN|nr:hypothetical protein [Streptomyces ureilyticus]NGO44196.1 hypothetical protein [Streptomyces ureilyticus]
MNTERPDDDAVREDAAPDETVEAEAVTDESVRADAARDETVPEAAAVAQAGPGQTASDEAATDETVRADAVTEDAAADEAVLDQAAPGKTVAAEAATDDAARDETVPGETVPEEAAADEAGRDETVREEASLGESAVAKSSPGQTVPDEVVRDEAGRDETGHPRRRRSVAVAASVVAAVLLVGGGGAYFATTASDGGGADDRGGSGTPGGQAEPPPLALDGYTESGSGEPNGIAPGEPDPNGTKYRLQGKAPEGPSSAPVYHTKGEVAAAEVADLAKALGVPGKPVAEGEAWKVGAAKVGTGPSLQVNKKAPGIWTYSEGNATAQDAKADPVSVDAAKKAAAPVLKAIGQDDAKLDASQLMGAKRVVNAEPAFGGLPTYGWTTGVQIGADGQVVGGSGQLKPPVKGDTYPVLDAQQTLDLLNRSGAGDGRVGIGGCATPAPLEEGTENAPCEPSTLKATPAAMVEKATFGLASQFVDGQQALVPSWLFEVRTEGAEETYTVTHPAVEPTYLTAPAPKPGNPGDDPSAEPKRQNVKVEGYSADDTKLTVRFTGGVCSDYSASVEETGDTVTVKVTETPWKDKVCIMIAKTFHKTVDLKEPLGDRKVVGTDGKALPLEKDLPKVTE